MRSADDQVHGKWSTQREPNLIRFAPLTPRRHDDEEIHIAVHFGSAVSERAEQDDLVGVKSPGNRASVTPDHAHGNVGRAVIPDRRKRKLASRCFGHDAILARKFSSTRDISIDQSNF